MKPLSALVVSAAFLLAGCETNTTPEQAAAQVAAQNAVLQRGATRAAILETFGPALKHTPTQVSEQAAVSVPSGSSWAAWRVRRRDEKADTARFSRSATTNVVDSNGASLSMPMGNPGNSGFKVLFLLVIFDSQDRVSRFFWLENVDESQ